MHVVGLAAEMSALVAVKPRQFIKTVAAIGTPERLTARAISAMTRVGAVVTVTTGVAHEFETGDEVEIEGVTPAAPYTGKQKITVTGATTFTYLIEGNPAAPALSSATASGHLWYRTAIVLGKFAARSANTGLVFLGPGSGNDTQPYKVEQDKEYGLAPGVGTRANLRDWYVDAATAGEGVVVLFM
jgi:hypothetical protein